MIDAITLSSRVRLARNFASLPFPEKMSGAQQQQLIEKTENALIGEQHTLIRMDTLSKNAKGVLTESRLISKELTEKDGSAVLLNDSKTLSVMIGEEDQLRIQAMLPGLHLYDAYKIADKCDRTIEKYEPFAFDPDWGYLTACPTNTGTGMRASVLLHLVGLNMLSQIGKVISTVSQVGLTVRGLYGEGSEASGHIYQLTNQVTLGRTESEILKLLTDTAENMAAQEKAARQALLEQDRVKLEDKLMRSFGLMRNAYLLSMREFMTRLSLARLASDLGMIPVTLDALVKLQNAVSPANLERAAGHELSPREQDELRAEMTRKAIQ